MHHAKKAITVWGSIVTLVACAPGDATPTESDSSSPLVRDSGTGDGGGGSKDSGASKDSGRVSSDSGGGGADSGPVGACAPGSVTWTMHFIDPPADPRRGGADGTGLADLDGDGDIDLVTPLEQDGVVRVYLNRLSEAADWTRVTVSGSVTTTGVEGADFGDVDSDGTPDVVMAMDGGHSIAVVFAPPHDLTNPAAWTGGRITAAPDIQWLTPRVGDIDGRNGADIAISGVNEVGWLEAPPDPRSFGSWIYHRVENHREGRMSTAILEDVDGDGDRDLISNKQSGASWWENDGTGASFAEHEIGVTGGTGTGLGWAQYVDLDGDGRRDLLTPRVFADGSDVIAWFKAPADPRGTWTTTIISSDPAFEHAGERGVKAVAAADLNRDGRIDIAFDTADAVSPLNVGDVFLLEWRASVNDTTWSLTNLTGRTQGKYDELRIVDLDRDGDLDLVTSIEREGEVWLENGCEAP